MGKSFSGVDVIGTLEPLVRELETTTVPNVLLKQITLLGKFAAASRKLISEAMSAHAHTVQPAQAAQVGDNAALVEAMKLPDGYEVVEHLPGIWGFEYDRDDGERMASSASWNHPALAAIGAWQDHVEALAAQPRAVPDGWYRLRDALAALVGSGDVAELRGMELALRELPAPDEDKAVTINAIHVLIATAPEAEVAHG